jgi:hypothetical protein
MTEVERAIIQMAGDVKTLLDLMADIARILNKLEGAVDEERGRDAEAESL